MDLIDENILCQLERNGRLTNLQLADIIGLSPSATSRRVLELERSGMILGYRAIINRKKQGFHFLAFVAVGLSEHTQKAQLAFERKMSQTEAVLECHNVTGAYEYILRVETTDVVAYKKFHTEVLGAQPSVVSITSFIVMESSKDWRK